MCGFRAKFGTADMEMQTLKQAASEVQREYTIVLCLMLAGPSSKGSFLGQSLEDITNHDTFLDPGYSQVDL